MFVLFTLLFSFAHAVESDQVIPYVKDFVAHSRGLIKLSDVDDSEYVFKKLKYDEDLEVGTIAQCVSQREQRLPFKIEFDPRFWAASGWTPRWEVVYHELGHCLCAREHTNDWLADDIVIWLKSRHVSTVRVNLLYDSCPISLMNSSIPSPYCADKHKGYYVKEMFEHCRKFKRGYSL